MSKYFPDEETSAMHDTLLKWFSNNLDVCIGRIGRLVICAPIQYMQKYKQAAHVHGKVQV